MDNFEGPQINIPVGNTDLVSPTSGGTAINSGWQGMTLKDILENVDLFNFTMLTEEDEDKIKETKASLTDTDSKVRHYEIFSSETFHIF